MLFFEFLEHVSTNTSTFLFLLVWNIFKVNNKRNRWRHVFFLLTFNLFQAFFLCFFC